MEYLPQIITVAGIHLLAVMSPGPDFLLVTRNALVHSRRSGVFSSIGLGLGMLTHITYCLAGIGLIISQSVILFNIIKFFGAAYLIYIGIKALTSKASSTDLELKQKSNLSDTKSLRMGYITNVTNPKATLFVLSLFTLVISPETPLLIKLVMGLEMAIVTALWFGLLSYTVSHPFIKRRFTKVQQPMERFMGGALILLGLKVALSRSR